MSAVLIWPAGSSKKDRFSTRSAWAEVFTVRAVSRKVCPPEARSVSVSTSPRSISPVVDHCQPARAPVAEAARRAVWRSVLRS